MKTNMDIPEWIKNHVESDLQKKVYNKYNSKKEINEGTGHDLVDIIFQVNRSLFNQIHHQQMFKHGIKDKEPDSDDDVPGIKPENIKPENIKSETIINAV